MKRQKKRANIITGNPAALLPPKCATILDITNNLAEKGFGQSSPKEAPVGRGSASKSAKRHQQPQRTAMRLFEEDYMDCGGIPTTFAQMERMLNDSGGENMDSDDSFVGSGDGQQAVVAFEMGANYALESDDVGCCDVSDEAWKKDIGDISIDLSDKSPIASNHFDDLMVNGTGILPQEPSDNTFLLDRLMVKTPGPANREPRQSSTGRSSTGRSKGSKGSADCSARRASGERRPRESPGDLSFSPDDNHSSISSRATLPETSGVSAGGRRESGERSTKLEHSCAKILTSPSGNHSAILS
ncbi:hypothetical protein T484DRAFT_1965968 [Baffinella frigidus]|nr:hypothetical protein T484DRAFT_1965968 [Cryptophyta sp. CCMP2293]